MLRNTHRSLLNDDVADDKVFWCQFVGDGVGLSVLQESTEELGRLDGPSACKKHSTKVKPLHKPFALSTVGVSTSSVGEVLRTLSSLPLLCLSSSSDTTVVSAERNAGLVLGNFV